MEHTKRRRILNACNNCKVKKRKCNGSNPCSNCSKTNEECVFEGGRRISKVKEQEAKIEYLEMKLSSVENELKEYKEKYNTLRGQGLTSESSSKVNDIFSNLLFQPIFNKALVGQGAFLTMVKKIKGNILGIDETKYLGNTGWTDESLANIPIHTENSFIDYFFMMTHSIYYVMDRYDFNHIVLKKAVSESSSWELFLYYAVLANGCRYKQIKNISSYPPSDVYFAKCIRLLQGLRLDNIQQIQSCLLLALYVGSSYVDTFHISSSDLVKLAMKKMVHLKLHRKQGISIENSVYYEFCKRLFWSTYNYDRMLSLSRGSSFSIDDDIINIPLPLSINEPIKEIDGSHKVNLFKLQLEQESGIISKLPISTFTTLIETSKMRKLEGEIFNNFYSNNGNNNIDSFNRINSAINEWFSNIPSKEEIDASLKGKASFEYFDLLFQRARLLLLVPNLISSNTEKSRSEDIATDCRRCAMCICHSYKGLYKESLLSFTNYALHSVFLAGMTLVYYMWYKVNDMSIYKDIRICSNLLFLFAERLPEAKSYLDIYESLISKVEQGKELKNSRPSQSSSGLENNQQDSLDGFSDEILFSDKFWESIENDIANYVNL